MDLFSVLFLFVISFFIGVIVTLVIQYYILYIYFKQSPTVNPPGRNSSINYTLPESLKKQLETEDLNDKQNGSSLPINLILQFLFHELRHSESIKRWLYKKLSLEFEELLTKTTIGKFFDTITIKDMNLGSEFPDLKDIHVEEVKLDKKEGYIDTLNICINLDYTGNFWLSVDGKMKFGRNAYLSIKVKRICGLARLQFTRHPYTHWSFSFYADPLLDLAVESHFQGRQLQANITNLIVNQIKKAIKRKHTLPNYKIRYKPFFVKTDPGQLELEDCEIVPQGLLEVTCLEVSRLEVPSNVQNVYCTMAVDTIPWICLYYNEDRLIMVLEITVAKLRQSQLGIIFKQEQNIVVVDSVSPHSSASRSGLKAGDVVVAVENKIVNSVPQVAKLIKSISSVNVTLRIERIAEFYVIKNKIFEKNDRKPNSSSTDIDEADLAQAEQDNFVIVETKKDVLDVKKSKCLANLDKLRSPDKLITTKLITTNENMSKLAQTIGNFSLRKRKTSISDRSTGSGDANIKGASSSSGPNTPQHTKQQQQQPQHLTQPPIAKKLSVSELPDIRTENNSIDNELNLTEILKGKILIASSVLLFNQEFQFNLKDGLKYLNINVWGTVVDEKDVLLGYINIPLSHVLNECCNSVLGHYMRTYSFLPPTNAAPTNQNHPLMSHSGFEQVFCYGDILLSFIWHHDDDIELKRKLSVMNFEAEIKSTGLTLTSKHDFIRTQFHRTTHCDFCTKKIWLKDAVQCRECGLCCHKKCIAKCQLSTGCIPSLDLKKNNDAIEVNQPEITMTEACDTVSDILTDNIKFNENLKRVNSVNSLTLPGSHLTSAISKSLPPSPQRTPSRKHSLAAVNPFSLCPELLEEIQNASPDVATEAISKVLEQIMICPGNETLMDMAKDSGKQLYTNMAHEERVEKINKMMAELKRTLDLITMEHMELSKQMSCEESEMEKTKLAFLMGQADSKVHGLSVLMLHYCSSLQHTQEKII